MQVSMNTVVTMTYELKDADGVVLESSDQPVDRKSTRLNSSHVKRSRMPSSA